MEEPTRLLKKLSEGNINIGKETRLRRILRSDTGRSLIVPIDDSLMYGPFAGLADLPHKLEQIASARPDAILSFEGAIRQNIDRLSNIPFILNLTASTVLSSHTRKVLISDAKHALSLGATGVAVHVNVSSQYESEMIGSLGKVSKDCREFGLPLVAIMYPRRESDGVDDNYDELKSGNLEEYAKLVAHASRIGAELGADIIKTQYTGSISSFQTVVEACSGVPVVIAGGPILSQKDALFKAYEAIQAGASGVSFGRNVFNRNDSSAFIRLLKEIVHVGKHPDELVP